MANEREMFEHGAGFEQGEVSGNVRLDKFEAYYEELFAEVIEDGVITAEERARLTKAAQSMGLDAERLSQLERAMQAVYEIRHRTRIVEATPGFSDDDSPRPSLQVVDPSMDPRAKGLQRRVVELEKRVAELEAELEAARAQVPSGTATHHLFHGIDHPAASSTLFSVFCTSFNSSGGEQ